MHISYDEDRWFYKGYDHDLSYEYNDLTVDVTTRAEIHYSRRTNRLLIKSYIQENIYPSAYKRSALLDSPNDLDLDLSNGLTQDWISEGIQWVRTYEHAGEYLWQLQQCGIKISENDFLVQIINDINYESWLIEYLCNRNK